MIEELMHSKVPEMLTRQISEMMPFVAKHYNNTKSILSQQHIMAIGKRYSMLLDSYIEIAQLFYREPRSEIEQRYFNIYLNSLYINIFGCIENLAWLIYFQIIYPNEKMDKRTITLFNKKLLSGSKDNGIDISEIKEKYTEWIREIKTKRDPISHQVPLYVPYRIITNERQKSEYKVLEQEAITRLNNGDAHGYSAIFAKARNVGEFIPKIWLVDSVEEELKFMPFREIINEDMLMLNGIVRDIIGKVYK